ncbi:MAG: hypothetical protein WKF57_04095 [Nakamurella sp.]
MQNDYESVDIGQSSERSVHIDARFDISTGSGVAGDSERVGVCSQDPEPVGGSAAMVVDSIGDGGSDVRPRQLGSLRQVPQLDQHVMADVLSGGRSPVMAGARRYIRGTTATNACASTSCPVSLTYFQTRQHPRMFTTRMTPTST